MDVVERGERAGARRAGAPARRRWSRVLPVLPAVLLLVPVAGCAADAGSGPAAPVAAGTGGAQHEEHAHEHDHTDEEFDLPAPEPSPTWDDAARGAAVRRAEEVLGAFARPGTPAPQWFAELSPLLTPQAAREHALTDPANVPARAVTGPGVLREDPSPYLAHVSVPTDVGAYDVLLVREGQGAPWLVDRLTPPEEVGP